MHTNDRNKKLGIILFAHGSSVGEANQGVHELARQVEAEGRYSYVRAAFLELAQPDLRTAIGQAVESGIERVIIMPYFLTLGIHLRRDLPNLIAPQKQKYPRLEVEVGQPLEGHPLLPTIILGRIQEALEKTKASP